MLVSRRIFYLILILALLLFSFLFSRKLLLFLQTYPAFKIKKIEVEPKDIFSPEQIKGILGIDKNTSIFSVNLSQLSQRLQEKPEVKRAVVMRSLPDRLLIKLVRRKAVAQIEKGKYYLVDREGVILSERNLPVQELPLIRTTIEDKKRIEVGEKLENHLLDKALELVDEFLFSEEFRIRRVEMASPLEANLILEVKMKSLKDWEGRNVEIKVLSFPEGREERRRWREKFAFLSQILSTTSPEEVKYIDLRFKDLIVRRK